MASKRKKQPKRSTPGIQKLKRQLQAQGIAARVELTPPGEDKLSAALLDLVAPFIPYANTLNAFQALVGIGVAAWNLPLLKGPQRQSFLKQVIQPLLASGGKEGQAEAQDMFNTLVKRKQRYFAHDTRLIVSYHVSEDRDEFRVAVAAQLADSRHESDK
jgi:hypothetical protein